MSQRRTLSQLYWVAVHTQENTFQGTSWPTSTNTDVSSTTSSLKKQVAKEVTTMSWHGQPLRTAPGWVIIAAVFLGGRGDRRWRW